MRKRILILGSIVFGLVAVYMLTQLFWPPGAIEISRNTTFLTKPLADDGLPDYSKYLLDQMRKGVTPENNGAIPFLQAMWPAEIDVAHRAVLCAELGMEVPHTDGMIEPYSDPELREQIEEWLLKLHPGNEYDAARQDLQAELNSYVIESPWRADDLPPLAEWLESHRREFDLLLEAAAREKYYLPSPTFLMDPKASWFATLLPHQQTLRSAVRSLSVRANYYIASGDLPAAWQDCMAIYKLSDTPKRQFLVSEIISIACEVHANRTVMELLASDELSPELAREIRDFLAGRPLRHNMRGCINESERFCFITTVIELSGEREPSEATLFELGSLPAVTSRVATDWNVVLQTGNKWYDQLGEALDQPTPGQRQQAVDKVFGRFDQLIAKSPQKMVGGALSRRTRSRAIGDALAALLLPAVDSVMGAEYRANDQLQLRQLAAELAVYHSEHDQFPESLAVLPEDVQARFEDQFGQPVLYQRTADGYLLYTQGVNGVDELGSNHRDSINRGYPKPEDKAADRALRDRLGLPEYEPEFEGDYQFLAIPENADDVAIRLPLINNPLPEIAPPDGDGEF